jgi:hypothetical protein
VSAEEITEADTKRTGAVSTAPPAFYFVSVSFLSGALYHFKGGRGHGGFTPHGGGGGEPAKSQNQPNAVGVGFGFLLAGWFGSTRTN